MVTQRTTLNKKVKELQQELYVAVLNDNKKITPDLEKKIEIAKSTLLNLD